MKLVDFGQVKVVNGKQGSKSNSTRLYTIPGDSCRAPAAGVVVLARNLALTGNTVVIDTAAACAATSTACRPSPWARVLLWSGVRAWAPWARS